MGGKERTPEGLPKKEMARLRCIRTGQSRPFDETADSLQRARDALGIPGKLDRGGIGQELALPADRSLDPIAAETSQKSNHGQTNAKPQPHRRTLVAARTPTNRTAVKRRTQKKVPEDSHDQNPVQDPHQPDVEAHVSVQDMAEFVGDDPLQLVT